MDLPLIEYAGVKSIGGFEKHIAGIDLFYRYVSN